MPNSQNRSNGKSGIVQPKRRSTKAAPQNPDTEQTGANNGAASKQKGGNSGSSTSAERKSRSGGSPNE